MTGRAGFINLFRVINNFNNLNLNLAEDILYGKLKLIQPELGPRVNMDTVLLASWVRLRAGKFKFIELGSAAGAVSLMLALRFINSNFHITGIEIQDELNNLAKQNLILNNLQDKAEFICGDLRDKELLNNLRLDYYDGVVANPPYETLTRGRKSEALTAAIARQDLTATIQDIASSASKLLKTRGRFFAVFNSERAASFINALLINNLTPKRIKFIYPRINENSKIFLIECVKNGGEGLIIEPPLIVLDGNNNYTPELLRAYEI